MKGLGIVSSIVTGLAVAPAGLQIGRPLAWFTLPPGAEPVYRVMRFVIQVLHCLLAAPCVQVHQVVDFVGNVVV